MKKISVSLFFAVMWKGICQALEFVLSVFYFKKDGKYARCVWGIFATSAAVVMLLIALTGVCSIGEEVYDAYNSRYGVCDNESCYADDCVYGNIYFHNHYDGRGYVYDKRTGEKLLKGVDWIAMPEGGDSLVCFSKGMKRGYFSKNTGQLVVAPKYDHAWVFSDGLASVDDGGRIKFIDGTGKVVIDKGMSYRLDMDGYVYHGGYCVVAAEEGRLYGLMDKSGGMALAQVYSDIEFNSDYDLWIVEKGDEMAVLDESLKPVVPFMACSIYVNEGTIDVTMKSDHTMRKYDLQGMLINDFYICSVRALEYEKDEIVYMTDNDDEDGAPFVESYHPKGVARLKAYVAGDGYEGLMTADGHVVMMPLYKDIEALGEDLYLCTSTNCDKVIVNGKGEIVR